MSFWNKIIGKKKNTKSIVVYERENKKLWDYVRLLTELLEEKDKEIKGLNVEIKRFEESKTTNKKLGILEKPEATVKKEVKKTASKTTNKNKVKSQSVVESKVKKVESSKPVVKKEKSSPLVKKSTTVKKSEVSKPKKSNSKEVNNEDTILNYIKSKKIFYDYKAISEGTNLPESIVRTMISRLKKRGIVLEEKKDGKRKLIKFVK